MKIYAEGLFGVRVHVCQYLFFSFNVLLLEKLTCYAILCSFLFLPRKFQSYVISPVVWKIPASLGMCLKVI